MDTNKILTELRAERERIDQAISAIEELNFDGATASPTHKPAANVVRRKPRPRRMSAAGRKRISEAAKARWARLRNIASAAPKKRAAKKAVPKPTASKKAPAKRGMSAANRRKMAALMKARWAAKKAGTAKEKAASA